MPPQEPAPAAVAEADELPEVPGLNVAEGLMRVAGNKKLYRKLLRQFSNTEADAAQRIAVRPGREGSRSGRAAGAHGQGCGRKHRCGRGSECGRPSGEGH